MPSKCAGCNKEFTATDHIAKCVDCSGLYHPACTKAGANQTITKTKLKTWKCDNCRGDSDSVRSSEGTNLEEVRTTLLSAISGLNEDLSSKLDQKLSDMKLTVQSATEEISKLSKKFDSLQESHDNLRVRCDNLERDRGELQLDVLELRQKLNDAEQHSRCNNIEIVGLPLTQKEDIFYCLGTIAQVIGVPFKREDISIAHRLRLYSKKHNHPPVIVQFVSRSVREAWLVAAKRRKGLVASDIAASLPPSNVYINEQLTPHNKALLGRAKRLMRAKKIHFAGFFNGKVLIKPTEEADSIRVMVINDLDKYDC